MKLCRFRQLEKAANNERLRNDCEFNIISLRPDPKRRRPSLRKRHRFYLWVGIKPLSHLGLAQLEGLQQLIFQFSLPLISFQHY